MVLYQHVLNAMLVLCLTIICAYTENHPNILWITVEDMSPHLGCYGAKDARTPHLDAFAQTAIRYTHAFATAPVCSPSRSCLITGNYATSLGTHEMRSHFPLPDYIRGFPAYLREAGYYCSNNVKTDYNIRDEKLFIKDAWNESSATAHWKKRAKDQPFFAVFNCMLTHQSRTSVWPYEQFEKEVASLLTADERHDPSRVTLPPYYPDTELARKEWARYHDCVTAMDKYVGELLKELADDGLQDDTIIFFYSDHGMGMPRGKRTLYDSGLHVPLLVHLPQKYQHLVPEGTPAVTDRLVSFVDFAPTVLSLANVKIPAHMQGIPFLGSISETQRKFVYGARARVDEAFDETRSVRDHKWLYIRNYMPHMSWMQPERYSDSSVFRREFTYLFQQGTLNADQLTFAAPRRAMEMLFDTEADPHNLKNLSEDPAYQDQLIRMRGALREWILTAHDAGFVSETDMWQRLANGKTPFELTQNKNFYPLTDLLRTAEMVGLPFAGDDSAFEAKDAGIRYWATLALLTSSNYQKDKALAALSDTSVAVRITAAFYLLQHDNFHQALTLLQQEIGNEDPNVSLLAARALQLSGERARPAKQQMEQVLVHVTKHESEHPVNMFIRFCIEESLDQFKRLE